jgi:hypothetical protein
VVCIVQDAAAGLGVGPDGCKKTRFFRRSSKYCNVIVRYNFKATLKTFVIPGIRRGVNKTICYDIYDMICYDMIRYMI